MDHATRHGDHTGTDQAALVGSTLAVVIAVTQGTGGWGPFNTVIGVALLLVLLGYYRRVPDDRAMLKRALAFASAIGLCLCMMLAWPLQDLLVGGLGWFRHSCGVDADCQAGKINDDVLSWLWLTTVTAWGGRAWLRSRSRDLGGSTLDASTVSGNLLPDTRHAADRLEVTIEDEPAALPTPEPF